MTQNNLVTSLLDVLNAQYALFFKWQQAHWNIEGPNFMELHQLFEAQYKEVFELLDSTAEHVRSLNCKIPDGIYLPNTNHAVSVMLPSTPVEILSYLIQSHQYAEMVLIKTLLIAENTHDVVIADYVTECLGFHRKAIWMLQSSK